MADKSGGRLWSVVRKAGGWLYSLAFKRGWPRWVFLAATAALFLLIVSMICGGADYRKDPSVLVPRSIYMYAETRDLGSLLNDAGGWSVWLESREQAADKGGGMKVAFAERISAQVAGLGTTLPHGWLAGAKKAALGFNADDKGVDSWAVYLEIPDAGKILGDIRVESGLSLKRADNTPDGVFELRGAGDGVLYLGIANPWLVVSSAGTLPVFAVESVRRPAFSLAGSGILTGWRRNTSLRGMFNPRHMAAMSNSATPLTVLGGWMADEARWSFSASLDRDGVVDARFVGGTMAKDVSGGGILWPLVKFILFLVGLLCLLLVLGTLSVMIGWSGWYKALAVKAGILPKPAPVLPEPSGAFREDAGVPAEKPEDATGGANLSEADETESQSASGIADDSPTERE